MHQFVNDSALIDKGLSNYWGYNTIGFFAPHNAYSSSGQRGQQVLEFKAMVRELHRAGIEVILDVVYNHTAEGNHLGPTLSFRGIDNAAYYRLVDEDKSFYYDTTGTGNTPADAQPARAAADHGLAALLGHRDARRRLPLRPRGEPGAAVPRGRPAERVLRPRAAGPGRLAGQADRRALGRRPRRLPGRQLPAPLDGVERQVPRHGARLLARRAELARRVRGPPLRLERPLRERRPGAVRLDQLRDRARRLHPARPGLLQREAQRGQRRGQQRRRVAQPLLELRRRGRHRRPRGARAARAPAAQLAGHAAAQPGRADDPARRRARPHARAATTTPTARTTRSRGSTGRASTRACSRSPAGCSSCAPSTRCSAGGASSPATQDRTACPTSPGSRRRHADGRRRLVEPADACRSPSSSTARASPSPACAARTSSTTRSCCSSTPATRTR